MITLQSHNHKVKDYEDYVIVNESELKKIHHKIDAIDKKTMDFITMKNIDELIEDIRQNFNEFIMVNTPRIKPSDLDLKLLEIEKKIELLQQKVDEKTKIIDSVEIVRKNEDDVMIKKSIPKLNIKKVK